jgi:hypothetical protein
MSNGYHDRGSGGQSDTYQQAYEQERARLDAAADRIRDQKAAAEAFKNSPEGRRQQREEYQKDCDWQRWMEKGAP